MKKVFVFFADGFEDIEALGTVDILRRGGIDVTTVSIYDDEYVTSTHGVMIKADTTFGEADFNGADMLVLPGGLPGADNLMNHVPLQKLLLQHNEKGGLIAAICAAPKALGNIGLLNGKRATCYPGCEGTMTGADYTAELCTIDGNIITGEGPAAVFPFAYTLLDVLAGKGASDGLQEGMMFNHLLGK
ncbi:MAG: DJ-1/PfpI family protein [Prevotellaceae bacterium]|nr:DJ-1/PfpI family protein [Prevotellaceae bacterium]